MVCVRGWVFPSSVGNAWCSEEALQEGLKRLCHALEQQLAFPFSIPSSEGYHELSSGKGFSQETMCLLRAPDILESC